MISDEIKARNSSALVLYTHGCKGAASYHLGKYKHWAKLVTSVDTTKTNGYAFAGEFLAVTAEHKVPLGSVIVEVCGKDIDGYVYESDGSIKVDKHGIPMKTGKPDGKLDDADKVIYGSCCTLDIYLV